MGTSIDDGGPFPEDLMLDILQRLPFKSLLRFKCISKNWYGLISSPAFVGKHFNYHGNKKRPKIQFHDIDRPASDDDLIPMIIFSEDDSEGGGEGTPLIEKPHHLRGFGVDKLFYGPVDGVFSFSGTRSTTEYDPCLGLWNPATRVVTTLPPVHFKPQPAFLLDIAGIFGFGFDPPLHNSSDYLNGTYYWIVQDDALLSFDFGSEVFHQNSRPDVPRHHFSSLMLLDGSNKIMAKAFNSVFTIWLMIEPGVWNKLHTFQCTSIIEPFYRGFWDSTTAIFLDTSDWLFSYDVVTQETKPLGFQLQGDHCSICVHYYKESLLPI
ncbi:hypothetical protein FXO38_04503 [Capsicum annuum]|nr:hypothetical protein FXO38_04503 [Capsicum annuum]